MSRDLLAEQGRSPEEADAAIRAGWAEVVERYRAWERAGRPRQLAQRSGC